MLDLFATSHGDQARFQAEVLALRRQVQVLERQIKRVRWTPGDSSAHVIFAGSRKFAEEWTYRFLGAAVADRIEPT